MFMSEGRMGKNKQWQNSHRKYRMTGHFLLASLEMFNWWLWLSWWVGHRRKQIHELVLTHRLTTTCTHTPYSNSPRRLVMVPWQWAWFLVPLIIVNPYRGDFLKLNLSVFLELKSYVLILTAQGKRRVISVVMAKHETSPKWSTCLSNLWFYNLCFSTVQRVRLCLSPTNPLMVLQLVAMAALEAKMSVFRIKTTGWFFISPFGHRTRE